MAIQVSVSTPADVVNIALGRIGYRWRVGNLYDGSEGAKAALDIYGQTRDALLEEQDWDFAERSDTLALLKSAPPGGYIGNPWTSAYPPLPWLFEYGYPDDCIKLRAVKAPALFVPNFDPQAVTFSIVNDKSYTPARKVVVANVQFATCVYTARITDPKTWKPVFVEALAEGLGRRLAPLVGNMDVEKIEAAEEQAVTAQAPMQRG